MTDPRRDPSDLRARLRSTALLEPFASSLQYIETTPPAAPVVAVPSDAQSVLEGAIIGHLRDLYDPTRDRRGQPTFAITGIKATKHHLRLDTHGAGVAERLHGLLPSWEPGQRYLVGGVPGLRYRARDAGVSFYLLDRTGAVTFTGISAQAFEAFRQQELASSGLRSVTSDSARRDAELRSPLLHVEKWRAASVVARRLGILTHPHVSSIDSWWNSRDRFVVELVASDKQPNPMPVILSHLLSPHLSPRLRLRSSDGYHHILSIEGSALELDVRMLRRNPKLSGG